MSSFFYILTFISIGLCLSISIWKSVRQLNSPLHIRWELYPLPRKQAGEYPEQPNHVQKTRRGISSGSIRAFLGEVLLQKTTFRNNRKLWLRTYPFHLGLYLAIAALLCVIACSVLLRLNLNGWYFWLSFELAQLFALLGFLLVLAGSLGLFFYRLVRADLAKFSTSGHFFNLGVFILWSAAGLGLTLRSSGVFVGWSMRFVSGLFTFQPVELTFVRELFLLVSCFLFVWIPACFMGHAFMKYYIWHGIRWNDRPAGDSAGIQAGIKKNLARPITWSANHVHGKTWHDAAAGKDGL